VRESRTLGSVRAKAEWLRYSTIARRPASQTRPLLLASAGGEPSDATAVRRHAGEDRGVAVTGGLGSSSSVAELRD